MKKNTTMNHHYDILIQADNISHQFGKESVLENISFTIKRHQIITLIGPNGAGKSTLLKILLKLIRPTQGTVNQQPNLIIGFMPQKIQVDPALPLTVEQFLMLGLSNQQRQSTNNITELKQNFKDLKLESLLETPIQKVSGGEMQRVLLARAIIRKPDLLVLDEPVQGVDIQTQSELYHLINEIKDKLNCGILMVSHDLHIVMKTTDEVLCLNKHMCCSGHPQAVSENPSFLQLFGSESEDIALYEHHHNSSACEHSHGEHHD